MRTMSTVSDPIDPVSLAQALIRRPSVTPADAGAMAVVEETLIGLGFACRRLPYGGIENLYAQHKTVGPYLCFTNHTDKKPKNNTATRRRRPNETEETERKHNGRGAV